MIKVVREKTPGGYVIRGSVKCAICESPFEIIEGVNATMIVNQINVVNGNDESMDLEAIAKCNSCEYTYKYNVKLSLND